MQGTKSFTSPSGAKDDNVGPYYPFNVFGLDSYGETLYGVELLQPIAVGGVTVPAGYVTRADYSIGRATELMKEWHARARNEAGAKLLLSKVQRTAAQAANKWV